MAKSAAFVLACLALAATAAATEIGWGDCPSESNAVNNFDVSAYTGKWYEIERYAEIWEAFGKCSTAEYTLNTEKNRVDVKNVMKSFFNIELKQEGYAEVTSKNGKGELLVTFDVPVVGRRQAPYWVLSTDYKNYAIVYSCTKILGVKLESAWVLGREKELSDTIKSKVSKEIDSFKLDKTAFRATDQKNC